MKFPRRHYASAAEFASDYFAGVGHAMASVDREAVVRAAEILRAAIAANNWIFACGNGGSASIANHLICDCGKGIRADTTLRPRVHSLSHSVEMVTAIGNDIGFEEVFAHQLQGAARPGDILVTISSSGDSEDIIRAITWAQANDMKVIAMSGFSGGRSARLADVSLHVACENYGAVEDVHQAVMHLLAQYLRQAEMSSELIEKRKF
jgi:D-sedoheptulose 7-phosphate isomerase